MIKRSFLLALGILMLVNYNLVIAKEKLEIKMEAFLITFEKKGSEFVLKRNPLPKQVKPEDIIEYQILVTNPTEKTFKNVFVKAPIPNGTTYIENSASEGAIFSIDGGKTYHKPPIKYKKKVKGKEIEKVATPDMYTNIGWNIEKLFPKEKKKFIYWVKVKK